MSNRTALRKQVDDIIATLMGKLRSVRISFWLPNHDFEERLDSLARRVSALEAKIDNDDDTTRPTRNLAP